MSRNPLMGIAGRWLREHLATDHRADERIDGLEWQAKREAQEQLGDVLLPGLRRRVEEDEARREARRAEEEAARRAAMTTVDGAGLGVRGDVEGPLSSPLLVQADRDEDVLLLAVEPADSATGGVAFQRLDLAVPGYRGDGTYDLRAAHDEDEWDPLWFQLALDTADEPFYWVPEVGVCTVTVAGAVVHLQIAFSDAGSRSVVLSGTVTVAGLGSA